MIVLIKLILAHLAGDFLFQPKSWVAEKEKDKIKSSKLYFHLLLHGILVLLLLWDFSYWFMALVVMLLHGTIDILKLYKQNDKNKTGWFLTDQLLHIVSLVIVYLIWFKPSLDIRSLLENSTFWIYVTALLFITVVSGVIIQILMQKWAEAINESHDISLKNAGKYIGILERLFVFTFIITGNWQAIGFLIAAKSVFRFGDLKESKDRKLTEYILIGTLLSFGIAIATGMFVPYLISILNL